MLSPVIFNIGSLEIRYYSLLLVLGFVLGYFILVKFGKEIGLDKKLVEDYVFYMALGIIIGARLFEILFYEPSYYFSNPLHILAIWEGGIASHGGMIGGLLVTYWFTKKHKISFYKLSDLVVIPIALGASFVRIGNFINQELVGTVTSVPWAVKFNNYDGLRHPAQLYQFGTDFITFLILYFTKTYKSFKEGTLTWMFFLIYSLFRFVTEFYKDLPVTYGFEYLGLNLAQWASLVIIIVSSYMLFRIRK